MLNILKKLYIFEGISDDLINDFIKNSILKDFKKGETIIKEGEKSNNAYILLSGIVGIYRGEKNISTIFEGDIFGEIALVLNEPRTATIKAETDVKTLVLNNDFFEEFLKNSPKGEYIKTTILNRIIQNNKK
ncbi:cyclic nucleotide-binding domain-containing protein [Candidatus Gracilibacteria bacterium]|nr:cyclic nucleotide-binding domain-containing protein [Candidatus Gracilibacteria bacterium]